MLSQSFRVLTLVLLASSALAAQKDEPKETPRSLYEKGAYAEEHERNFQKAADLFAAAAAAATQAGDDKTAVEATAARDRAFGRAGQTTKPQVPVDCSDPILRRIADLLDSVVRMPNESNELFFAKRDLALFGALAVPWVERAVSESFPLCNYTITPRTDRFVSVLAMMSSPEADAALERLLGSTDPITRREVARNSNAETRANLLKRAIKDPVSDVREAAMSSLSKVQDPSWQPIVVEFMRSGGGGAAEWLAKNAPLELVRIAVDPALGLPVRTWALSRMSEARTMPPDSKAADQLLELARSGPDQNLRRTAIWALTALVDRPWRAAPESLRQEIESALAANISAYPTPEAWDLLLAVGGGRSMEALTGSIVASIDLLDDDAFRNLTGKLMGRFGELTTKDFASVAAAFARLPSPGPIRNNPPTRAQQLFDLFTNSMQRLVGPSVPDSVMAASLALMHDEQRTAFLRLMQNWLDRRTGRDEIPASVQSLDPALLPTLREFAQGTNDQKRAAARGLPLIGDIALWPELLPLATDQENAVSNSAKAGVLKLVSRNRSQAAAVLERALVERQRKDGVLDDDLLSGLAYLEQAEALALAKKLWPMADVDDERSALLNVLAIYILGPEASAFLLEHYKDIPKGNWELRQAAVNRFGMELYQPAVQTLGQALEDSDDNVRQSARQAFTRFKAQREAMEEFKAWMSTDKAARDSTAQLVALLDNANKDVVLGAVRSLASLKAKSALPALVKLLEKNDPEIKKAVQDAITKIGE